ncbi:hypothetical protein BD779DRAFT_1510325 [Infundibulicybe gibba]|nr:hypothetical protein BD779DRAFT_1510325 [Infundibulicybe gibba]
METETASNSLGLDFSQLKIQEGASKPDAADTEVVEEILSPQIQAQQSPQTSQADLNSPETRERKKPYVNPERVKTGGSQRDKLSEEALTERMARMREQNEKIKQRRMDVKADEDAFKKTQESERIKLAHTRKVQENVDRTREQNAKRKMDKIQSREWDSGKPSADWKSQAKKPQTPTPASDTPKEGNITGVVIANPPTDTPLRGGGTTHGRGRGRGRGGANAARARLAEKPVEPAAEKAPEKPTKTDNASVGSPKAEIVATAI